MKIVQKTNKEDLKKYFLSDEPEPDKPENGINWDVWQSIHDIEEELKVIRNKIEAHDKLFTKLKEKGILL